MTDFQILQLLGESNRFRVFKLLLESQKEICNCEFVDALRIPKYGLSKHLDALVKAGVVKARKEGRWVYYSACATKSAFCNAIYKAVRIAKEPTFNQDMTRFNQRLKIRVEGKCVLGVQGKKLNQCC